MRRSAFTPRAVVRGPAAPVGSGRLLRLRLATPDRYGLTSVDWHWGDGVHERWLPQISTPIWAAHRYTAPGVYTVRVLMSTADQVTEDLRDVAVFGIPPADREVAGSGRLRAQPGDPSVTPSSTFAFWARTASAAPAEVQGRVTVRAPCDGISLDSADVRWLLVGRDRSCHLGGVGRVTDREGDHPYRLDALVGMQGLNGSRGRLVFSLYAPGTHAGYDAPIVRLAGSVWPGRVVVLGVVAQPFEG